VIQIDFRKILIELKPKMQVLANEAKTEMRYWVKRNLYDAYTPKPVSEGGYLRTNQLLNSITLSDVKIINTPLGVQVEFEVYFDSSKMYHTSVVTGERVNVPYLLDKYGHHHETIKYPIMFHQYPARNFTRDMMEAFKDKLQQKFAREVIIMIERINDY
jgi:hypothetical protein